MVQPRIILLDEPFSAISESGRKALWVELKSIIREIGITAIHITHNLEEAYALGERISILIEGKIAQFGKKEDIFENPVSEAVARYLNYRNIFRGTTTGHPRGTVINLGHFRLFTENRLTPDTLIRICIRPQDIKIIREGFPVRDNLKNNILDGTIVSLLNLPDSCLMLFKIEGSPSRYDLEVKFPAYIAKRYQLAEGQRIRVAIWEPRIIVLND